MTETKAFSSEETKIMERNGVTKGCAWNRIKRLGWSRERAITKPPIKKAFKNCRGRRKSDFEARVYYDPRRCVSTFLRKSR